jgi:hypothetical protein
MATRSVTNETEIELIKWDELTDEDIYEVTPEPELARLFAREMQSQPNLHGIIGRLDGQIVAMSVFALLRTHIHVIRTMFRSRDRGADQSMRRRIIREIESFLYGSRRWIEIRCPITNGDRARTLTALGFVGRCDATDDRYLAFRRTKTRKKK